MQIVFVCPAVRKITGGIKCIFRMAATLRRLGHDGVVFAPTGSRPSWFATDVPVFDRSVFSAKPEQIVVLPEDQPIVLERFASRPQRKVVYCQNYFYAASST